MRAMITDVCIRGCERRENKKGEGYLLVRFEDSTGKPEVLVDKEMDRQSLYKIDMVGTIHFDIETGGKYHNMRITNFIPDTAE